MSEIIGLLGGVKLVPAFVAPAAAIAILLLNRKPLMTYVLGVQYAMVAWLVAPPLPLESAGAKLLAGWIATVVLYLGAVRATSQRESKVPAGGFPKGRVFRLIAILLVVIGILGVSFEEWMPLGAMPASVERAASLLVALGILGLGFSISPMQVGISLITVVSGFEIIYSAIEPSLAIVFLIALVHLGIALTVSYFEIISADAGSELKVEG